MRTKDLQKNNLPKTNIKSTVMFALDYEEEITKTIDLLANYLDINLEKNYQVDYVDVWVRSIKIKINDEEKFIFKTINCIFDYNKVDEKYWNTRIELTITELSKKPTFSLIWKFNITNREEINRNTLKEIIKKIEEIN